MLGAHVEDGARGGVAERGEQHDLARVQMLPHLGGVDRTHLAREAVVDAIPHSHRLGCVEEVAAHDVDAHAAARARARAAPRERALDARAHEAVHLLHSAHRHLVGHAHHAVAKGGLRLPTEAQRLVDLPLDADDEHRLDAEQRERCDLLHELVE